MLRAPFPVLPPTLVRGTWNPPTAISPPPFQGMPPVQQQPRNRMPFPMVQRFRRGGVAGGGLPAPDFPPANETTDYNFPSGPIGGPTVLINPPGLRYNPPSTFHNSSGPAASMPTTVGTMSPGGITPGGWDPFGNSIDWGPKGGIGVQGGLDDYGKGPAMTARYLQHGGVVPGHRPFGMPHDTVPAMLDPGEVVLNRGEQRKISLEPREKKALPPSIVAQMYRSRMGGR